MVLNSRKSGSAMLAHEQLRKDDGFRLSSSRSFGITLTVLLTLIGLFPLLKSDSVRWPFVIAAVCVLALALASPNVLGPVHRLWFLLVLALHRVTNPIIMGFLFFGLLTPIGLIIRAFGGRGMDFERNRDADATSYWTRRNANIPTSMKQAF